MEEVDEKFFQSHGFEFRQIIAKGGYGLVYLVFSEQYQQEFAMKRVLISHFKPSEIKCMMALESQHICSLYQYYYFDQYVYMLLEYCPTSLQQIVIKHRKIPEEFLVRYIYNILLGIKECHSHNIAHSDIKPGNFLLDKYGRIKVCDFGLSNEVDPHGSNCKQGSLIFMAPEIFRKAPYDPIKADIWSLGVTFYNMATGTFPFKSRVSVDHLKEVITKGEYDETLIQNPHLKRMISQCLNLDPMARPSVDELLKNPFLTYALPVMQSSGKRSSANLFKVTPNINLAAVRRNKIGISASCNQYQTLPKLKRHSF